MTNTSTFGNFIDGVWADPGDRETIDNRNPARPQDVLNRHAQATTDDVDAAVAAAGKALPEWRRAPIQQRAAILHRFADLLDANRDRLGRIITLEQGKPLREGIGEVGRAAMEARFMAGEALRIEGRTYPSERPGRLAYSRPQPLGIVVAVCPWNFPIVTPVRKMAPALACGNTLILKPASATCWSAVETVKLLVEAGVPNGVVNLILGAGGAAGDHLVGHPAVDGITFTGSTEVGRRIAGAAGERLIPVQMELGGKNPALVWQRDDLDRAADEIVSAAFQCAGQRCTAISRVIVGRNDADALTDRLRRRIEALIPGDGLDETTTLGPLVNRRQLEAMTEYVSNAAAVGQIPVSGGRVGVADPQTEGYFFQPTLFTDVSTKSPLATEEMFGPILPVITVDDLDEAIAVANETRYGLAASIFTSDMAAAHRCIDEIDSGMVHVNHGTASQAHIPFGGVKESGVGAYSIGHTAMDFFTRLKIAYVDPS